MGKKKEGKKEMSWAASPSIRARFPAPATEEEKKPPEKKRGKEGTRPDAYKN